MKNIMTVLIAAMMTASLATAQTATVPQGTVIRLRISQNVSSADAKAGDAVTLEVLDDVQVGGVVAIRHGAPARGEVLKAHGKRTMGRAGMVEIGVRFVEAADGSHVAVSADEKKKGDNGGLKMGVGAVILAGTPLLPVVLLFHGHDTNIEAGTPVNVFVTGDANVDMAKAPALVVPVAAKLIMPEQANGEHKIEGYTIS
jgi:hypothetical protein